MEYKIYGNGTLEIVQDCALSGELPYWLPRYGYLFEFAEPLCEIRYFGYGSGECYEDKRSHAMLGCYEYIPDDPYGAYEKPQESGSHFGTKWLRAKTKGRSIRFMGDFSFCASRYSLSALTSAAHRKDLVLEKGTNLYIDYRMSGVGSASCGGQEPVRECRIEPGEMVTFTVRMKLEFEENRI